MKSCQISFFMHPKDTEEFCHQLTNELSPLYIAQPSPTETPTFFECFRAENFKDKWLTLCLVRKDDRSNVRTNWVPAQEYWLIDELSSPILQFSRSFLDQNVIRAGRIYFIKENPLDGGNKDPAFTQWGSEILKRIRAKYQRDAKTGFFVGPHAHKWKEQNNGSFAIL